MIANKSHSARARPAAALVELAQSEQPCALPKSKEKGMIINYSHLYDRNLLRVLSVLAHAFPFANAPGSSTGTGIASGAITPNATDNPDIPSANKSSDET